jgi:hypothetical protein
MRDFKKELNEFEQKMYDKYPEWFKGLKQNSSESCLAFGFEINEGWYPLIEELCEKIKEIVGDGDFEVQQVKEKFGTLRFYYHCGTDAEVSDLVWDYEEKSGKICEVCGEPGVQRRGGWLVTLCEKHHLEREEREKELRDKYDSEI